MELNLVVDTNSLDSIFAVNCVSGDETIGWGMSFCERVIAESLCRMLRRPLAQNGAVVNGKIRRSKSAAARQSPAILKGSDAAISAPNALSKAGSSSLFCTGGCSIVAVAVLLSAGVIGWSRFTFTCHKFLPEEIKDHNGFAG